MSVCINSAVTIAKGPGIYIGHMRLLLFFFNRLKPRGNFTYNQV
jgi:hypothetical protein